MSIRSRTIPTATTRTTTNTTLHAGSVRLPRSPSQRVMQSATMMANTKSMRTLLYFLFAIVLSATSAKAQQRFRDGDTFRMAVGGAPVEYTQEFNLEYTI